MKYFYWPFKIGNDEDFRVGKSLYDSVGDTPRYDFRAEFRRYNEGRWRKGWIHNILPALAGGGSSGFLWGLYQSRRGNIRHISRPMIIFTHTASATGIALATTVAHQFFVVSSSYQTSLWQPLAAGTVGGCAFGVLTETTGLQGGMIGGFLVGLMYAGLCVGIERYSERSMVQFFSTQQRIETPIHRVPPELQPMYRSWLYDNRPLEDSDVARRQALLLERDRADLRLDAQSFMEATKTTVFDRIVFPEWWPLKLRTPSDEEALVSERKRNDDFKRRSESLAQEDTIFSHALRTAQTNKRLDRNTLGDE